MASRKLPKEVQRMFDQYVHNNVRRLKRDDALVMFEKEFEMTPEQAAQIFDSFDKDRNGIMSIWEFEQFYHCVGNGAHAMVESFQKMDTDNSGKLDMDEAREGLKKINFGERQLTDKEIEFFLKNSLDENNLIDLGHFANLLFRLKVYEKKTSAKN
ncbi:hypothetical protein NP493_322g01027 [Ridgeia piscesae]|uniref:EF-hand domain-containing protein n=1 Tax=Ridgeia piscesae TaxID=27915 RepID=A0AAD9L4Z9_RIDPI|nr:hypothetical protein NP493_322g01027 [Ridgeia piscesae]